MDQKVGYHNIILRANTIKEEEEDSEVGEEEDLAEENDRLSTINVTSLSIWYEIVKILI
jgi:hypothetical protein